MAYAVPNLPASLCADSHLKPPFFGYKRVAGLFRPALQAEPFCTLCIFLLICKLWHGLQGRKRKCIRVSCWLRGEMLIKFKQSWGLQDFSWPEMADFMGWDEYSGSLLALPFSSKWTAAEALRGKKKLKKLSDLGWLLDYLSDQANQKIMYAT